MVATTKGMAQHRAQMPDPTHTFEGRPTEKRWAQDMVRMTQMALDSRTPDDVGRGQLILLDPTGAAWGLTVSTTGTLTATKLKG